MCADFYTRLLHIAALGLHVQHSCALCFFTYKSTHSDTHVCLRTPGLLELALLGLGPGLELATQLACTPPLQLGTRLLRVALVNHSLPPSTACVGYV